ncbi:MAG: endonuclease/exonuclease/phosphatase family protein [Planctomycetota bacterium]|nr:endonuclease/exonuclease/phosphatase family protein [Planctomycetota bacterium]MDP6954693.1 endonuclease/exonuclease/phosphatase family protein [Planctomycetota bacterium]
MIITDGKERSRRRGWGALVGVVLALVLGQSMAWAAQAAQGSQAAQGAREGPLAGIQPEDDSLRILTWNVHLFGKTMFGLGGTYADDQRRVEFISEELSRLARAGMDVVVLQEVWDDGMARQLIRDAGFPHGVMGADRTLRGDVERTFLGSGLVILSRYPLERVEQVAFAPTQGYDSFTSKGFVMCDVKLAGRTIGLVTTHLHAGGGEETEANRKLQIAALGEALAEREGLAGPAAMPCLIAGDFNTSRESPARHEFMLESLGTTGQPVVDAWIAAEETEPESGATAVSHNTLRRFFNDGRRSRSHSIDYCLLRADGQGRQPFVVRRASVRRFVLSDEERPFGEIAEDDGSVTPVIDLSDHLAVEVELELVAVPVLEAPTVGPLPGRLAWAREQLFTKWGSAFGIDVIAMETVSEEKLLHALHVLAQYIDNDEDGEADDKRVLAALREHGALLVMAGSDRELERLDQRQFERAGHRLIQDLYGRETHPAGSSLAKGFDATLEEVWHLVSFGWAATYPEVFGFERGSRLAQAMDLARGGYHRRMPRRYPAGAWYSYYDRTCDYRCQVAEYSYWTLITKLGGQSYAGRAREIADEWRLTTPDELQSGDPAVWSLLSDSRWRLPRVLPDGSYGD